jgi:hypothetical protein
MNLADTLPVGARGRTRVDPDIRAHFGVEDGGTLFARLIVVEPQHLRLAQSACELSLDDQGRTVIPVEQRRDLGINGLEDVLLQAYLSPLDDTFD